MLLEEGRWQLWLSSFEFQVPYPKVQGVMRCRWRDLHHADCYVGSCCIGCIDEPNVKYFKKSSSPLTSNLIKENIYSTNQYLQLPVYGYCRLYILLRNKWQRQAYLGIDTLCFHKLYPPTIWKYFSEYWWTFKLLLQSGMLLQFEICLITCEIGWLISSNISGSACPSLINFE